MSSAGDGCTAHFGDSELRRVLPPKLLELYERVRQRRDVEAAGLDDMEECPFCDFKMIFEVDADTDKLFRCQNPECEQISCRKCKKIVGDTAVWDVVHVNRWIGSSSQDLRGDGRG